MRSLTIRVSDEEHKLILAVAAHRFMSVNGVVRAHFHDLAVQDGLILPPDAEPKSTPDAKPAKPPIERRPIPLGVNAWRDEIMNRVNAGEPLADVAESYGVALKDAKAKLDAAREFHTAQSLKYDPVDPDNPTEAEQRVNAEIARRRLQDMGLL